MKRWNRWLPAVAVVLLLACHGWGEEAQKAAVAPPRPRACVIDMDGTIANETARRARAEAESPREKDRSGYYRIYFDPELVALDKPIEKSREVLKWVSGQGVDIYYVSSRGDRCLNASEKWLENNGFPKAKGVYLRGGFKRTVDFKIETINRIKENADVLFGVGDRDADMEAYKKAGIVPIKVEENSDESWMKHVKPEIEKILKEKGEKK